MKVGGVHNLRENYEQTNVNVAKQKLKKRIRRFLGENVE